MKINKYVPFLVLFSFFVVINTLVTGQSNNQFSVQAQWVEQQINPVGIDVKQPRFTWKLMGNNANLQQTAYQIQVLKSNTNFDAEKANFSWNSDWIQSNQSHLIMYGGKALTSRTLYYWRVRIKNENGSISGWSKPARWVTGLLDADNEL